MAVETTKDWQSSVTDYIRDNLVQKIVQAIFANPLNDPNAIIESSLCLDFAKALEWKCYNMAESRSEYYFTVAAKIYRIQKFLEDHRMGRRQDVRGDERNDSISSNEEPSNSEQATFMADIQEQLEALRMLDSADE